MTNLQKWIPSSRLTLGCSEEVKESLTSKYKLSRDLFEHIIDMLEKDLAKTLETTDSEELFRHPNWELHQAYLAGKRNSLRSFLHLIKPKTK